ncbi:MAG: AAA family ATPase [Planctomycetota bacterium]|nr:MAG: AAA family ATPase [Planctomycetota bacterium]
MPPAPEAASLERAAGLALELHQELARRHLGDEEAVELLVAALLAGGHVLIEGAPGLGKTRLVRDLAALLDLSFGRLQCTPDLMPADVTGGEVLTDGPDGRGFRFVPGPVFHQVVLADEINRATPRTQSALLEAMAERQVSSTTGSHPLPDPFFLCATQNPIELEGTYPLPEAQLDRFLFQLLLVRPDAETLARILELPAAEPGGEALIGGDQLAELRRLAALVPLPAGAARQVAELIEATHPDAAGAPDEVREHVRWGASPRAGQALLAGARARALLRGRAHVSPEDLRAVAPAALRHRVLLRYEAAAAGVRPDQVVAAALRRHPLR